MNNTIIAFFISFLAGASTIIGALLIFFIKNRQKKVLIFSLAFSSSVMFFLSILDLIPESLNFLKKDLVTIPSIIIIMITITIGLKLAKLINKKVMKSNTNSNLYKVGLISMISIIIHNIPEGIATFISSKENIMFGISLSIAIAMHNIPEGISIALPLYYANEKKSKAIFLTAISGLSELLGAIITYLFLTPFINNITMGILFSVIAGIMLYISIFEILKEAISYNNKKTTLIGLLFGLLFISIYFLFL